MKEKKEKKGKENHLLLKIVLGVIIVGIIVFTAIFIKGKVTKKNSNEDETNEIQQSETGNTTDEEEFVRKMEDGTKLNVNSKIIEDREVEGLRFTNIQLIEKDNQSTLLADVENTTEKDINDYTNLDITFLTKDGQEIITVKGILIPLKAGEKTQLNTGLLQDVANAYDMIIRFETK